MRYTCTRLYCINIAKVRIQIVEGKNQLITLAHDTIFHWNLSLSFSFSLVLLRCGAVSSLYIFTLLLFDAVVGVVVAGVISASYGLPMVGNALCC